MGRGKAAFLKVFGVDREDFEWSPRFNIAPTQQVPTIRQDRKEPKRWLGTMRWGLVPFWAKDLSMGAKMINARSETAADKPAFRECLQKRRCLIPADGFYEWKKLAKAKQPYCFQLRDEHVFAFAGIWDRWKDHEGKPVETCSIMTTAPNALTEDVHDRMPYEASQMKRYPVSARVNAVANDGADVAAPASEFSAESGSLPGLFGVNTST